MCGWAEQPEASLNDLAETAADLGVSITAQGLDERINAAAVALFEALSQESLRWPLDVAVLRQFTAVEILDSRCIALPATRKASYPGSGGDGPAACLKVQWLLDFLTGELQQIIFQTGCDPDQAYEADLSTLRPGVLRLSDLGYFKLERFQTIADRQAYFLTRLDLQTTLRDAGTDEPFDLLTCSADLRILQPPIHGSSPTDDARLVHCLRYESGRPRLHTRFSACQP